MKRVNGGGLIARWNARGGGVVRRRSYGGPGKGTPGARLREPPDGEQALQTPRHGRSLGRAEQVGQGVGKPSEPQLVGQSLQVLQERPGNRLAGELPDHRAELWLLV